MRQRTILLAVRIGSASLGPARTAAWLAGELGARVTVLYVAVELETAAAVATGAGLDEEVVRERIRAEAAARAERFAAEVLGGVAYEVIIGQGDVPAAVVAAAERVGADLVVTGPQGGGVASLILGDTTRDILRRTPCPVVVVPPEGQDQGR
jgi:nucleotide-binding universal stress UspA family protein